jgi:hypothetical protein
MSGKLNKLVGWRQGKNRRAAPLQQGKSTKILINHVKLIVPIPKGNFSRGWIYVPAKMGGTEDGRECHQ